MKYPIFVSGKTKNIPNLQVNEHTPATPTTLSFKVVIVVSKIFETFVFIRFGIFKMHLLQRYLINCVGNTLTTS